MFAWITGIFLAGIVLERLFPGWQLPSVRTWPWRALAINAVQLLVVVVAGHTWERWLDIGPLVPHASALPTFVGGLVAYLLGTFVFYWWHRWRHESDWLRRRVHQIHHSAQRLEMLTSFYKHPLEMVINSLISATLVYAVLGLSPAAGACYTLLAALGEFFYHANWRTPRWVGYVFQRPEMHRIHHEYGWHRSNYGDIVWWDMMFGTYENPRAWEGRCGFDPHREERLGDMLAFRDVHGDRR